MLDVLSKIRVNNGRRVTERFRRRIKRLVPKMQNGFLIRINLHKKVNIEYLEVRQNCFPAFLRHVLGNKFKEGSTSLPEFLTLILNQLQ